jgi:hypothetical protein
MKNLWPSREGVLGTTFVQARVHCGESAQTRSYVGFSASSLRVRVTAVGRKRV